MRTFINIKSLVILVFFIAFFLVGSSIYSDYGIPWDEVTQRKTGYDLYRYIKKQDAKYLTNQDRFYGLIFELFLVVMELPQQDIREIYLMRHFATFSLFFISIFFFFLLIKERYKSTGLGLLAITMLILTPRIFSHSFYNTKDLPFMSLFIITMYFLHRFTKHRTLWLTFISAILTALTIDIRIMGVVIPFLLIGVSLIDRFKKDENKKLSKYLWLTAGFTILFAPILWKYPVGNFIESFKYYPQNTSTLYYGTRVKSLNVPWHYTLGWILVTVPISYTFTFLIGLLYYFKDLTKLNSKDLLMFGWFITPLLASIILKSVLSDAWRHMFFIYPPLVYFSIYSLTKISLRPKIIFLSFLVINMFFVLLFMIKEHPYQNIYFNELVRPPYETKFELDYWGLSYKQAYEYIAKNDKRPNIKVFAENLPGETNIFMLEKSDRDRFEYTNDKSQADYYLTNYRKYKNGYYEPVFYSVNVKGTRILGVHKLK